MRGIAFVIIVFCALTCWGASDPLPSWNDSKVKEAIVKFVTDVTTKGNSHYVEPENRIATFDNDGTLWCEVPTVEVEFAKRRLHEVLEHEPTLKNKEPYYSLLTKGKAAIPTLSQKEILEIVAKALAGMSEETFEKEAKDFFATAKHPKMQVPYSQTAYQPMLELLAYLKDSGFKNFISSGGDIAFMRIVTEDMYGIPPERIIGSFFVDKTMDKNGKLEIFRTSTLGLMNDKDNKPVGIVRHIGRRPIFSAGNVRNGGDIAHLRYSSEGSGETLQLMINHDDADREAAYQEKDNASLNAAKKFGWQVVSMKKDWKQIFKTQPLAKSE